MILVLFKFSSTTFFFIRNSRFKYWNKWVGCSTVQSLMYGIFMSLRDCFARWSHFWPISTKRHLPCKFVSTYFVRFIVQIIMTYFFPPPTLLRCVQSGEILHLVPLFVACRDASFVSLWMVCISTSWRFWKWVIFTFKKAQPLEDSKITFWHLRVFFLLFLFPN